MLSYLLHPPEPAPASAHAVAGLLHSDRKMARSDMPIINCMAENSEASECSKFVKNSCLFFKL